MNKSRPDSGKKAFFIKYRDVWGCLFLVVITLTAYWSVQDYDFVNFDDGVYVTENPHIQEGLTLKSVIWAFSFSEKEDTYWHPVTWLSHALDCQLYGLQSGKHHLTVRKNARKRVPRGPKCFKKYRLCNFINNL